MTLKTESLELDALAADPGSPADGQLWRNSTDDALRVRHGSNTRTVEDKLNNFTGTTDPTINNDNTQGYAVGSKWINTTSGDFFWLADPATGAAVWKKSVEDAATPSQSYRRDINPGVLITTGNASKVVTNDFGAIELPNNQSAYGVWSNIWRRTPETSVTATMYFKLKDSGSGTIVRAAVKYKARAVGGTTAGAFDQEVVKAVTVNPAAPDTVYSGEVLLNIANFAEGDAVAMMFGRDGGNDITSGEASDDFNRRIQMIGIELETI